MTTTGSWSNARRETIYPRRCDANDQESGAGVGVTAAGSVGRGRLAGVTIVLLGTAFGVLVVGAPSVVAVVVPMVAMTMALIGLVRWLGRGDPVASRRVMAWTLGAFVAHFAIGWVIWSSPTLTGYFGGDALTYHYGALGLLQHWTAGAPAPGLPSGKRGFFYLLGGLYWVFGAHPAAGLAVDAAMAAAVIPLISDATRRLFGPEAARPVPLLCTFLPGFLLWGSQLLREAGVYFLIAACLACAVRLRERVTPGALVGFATAAGLLVLWRADVGLIVAGGLGIGMALGRGRAGGALAGASALALVAVLVLGLGVGYSGYHLVTHANLSLINGIRSDSSQSAASGFLPNANVSTPAHAAGYLPLGSLYFLFGPFPWQIHGGRQLFGLPDSLAWWFLLPSLWRGARASWSRYRWGTALSVLPALALAGALSLFVANFGTTVRERMQVILLLVPLVALGWSMRKVGRLTRRTSGRRPLGSAHQGDAASRDPSPASKPAG